MEECIEKNMKKKIKQFTDDQMIEIFENSREMENINEMLAKKVIIRDLIK